MKINRKFCTAKCDYLRPEMEVAEIATERGFADSIEIVGKDNEVEF